VTKKFLSHRRRTRSCHTFLTALFFTFFQMSATPYFRVSFEKKFTSSFVRKLFLFLFYFNYINLLVSGYQNFDVQNNLFSTELLRIRFDQLIRRISRSFFWLHSACLLSLQSFFACLRQTDFVELAPVQYLHRSDTGALASARLGVDVDR